MKVGIMSMQRIKNYGSFLQAYSLKKNIESLGHTVEFVDYKVDNTIDKFIPTRTRRNILGGIRRKIGIYTREERLSIQRRDFLKKYDTEFYNILGLNETLNISPQLDVLVIGSDEVFNCLQTNRNVGYSLQLFGEGNNANRLISYAASAGNTTVERLKGINRTDEIAQLLKKFDTLSVRDENTYRFVNQLTEKAPLMHVDPVFLYDFPESKKYQVGLENYIVVYAYTNRIKEDEAKVIVEFARSTGRQIVCLGECQMFCDTYIPANPFEVLAYIKRADYVITDTFHGTVFSITQNTPFVTIIRESINGSYGNAEKLTSLLKHFNLESRIVKEINSISKMFNETIDFQMANSIILEERERSISYLRENIK